VSYETPQALRTALERRLLARSVETGISLDRLRRRVLFERIVARLQAAEPGRWVLKGGMALEVRLRDAARLTKDIDFGLRDEVADPAELHERLIDALSADPDRDNFMLTVRPPVPLGEDGGGHLTWRLKVAAHLADKPFGGIQLDVSPRTHELDATDRLALPNSLEFAGIPAPEIEIVDVHRHAAEKFHAMLRDFGDRENSRVRDLVDLVILIEHGLLTPATVTAAARNVWAERDGVEPPDEIPPLPGSWPDRYERLAADHDMDTQAFPAAVASVARLWAEMFPAEET
jgi:hypothetical protein